MCIRFARSCEAARRAARIVQFMHQPGGQRSKRRHFLLLDRNALHLLKPVGHVAQDRFAHRGAGRHQAPELVFVKLHQMAWPERLDARRIRNISQQRQFAKGISRLDLSQRDVTSVGSGLEDAQLAFEQDVKEMCRIPLMNQDLVRADAKIPHTLHAVQLFILQGGKKRNLPQFSKQLCGHRWGRCNWGRYGLGWLAHRGLVEQPFKA
jgi:hypothetical protein